MICNLRRQRLVCCNDVSLIENYEKAISDTENKWVIHHRLETHNSNGERRLVDLSEQELIALGIYYNRPAEELIFLTKYEHDCLHSVGKPHTDEVLQKMSKTKLGKSLTNETKQKISKANKGRIPCNKGKRIGHLDIKYIICIETGEIHSGKEWTKLGYDAARKCAAGIRKISKGLHFKYIK